MSIVLNKRAALVSEIIKYRLENGEMPTSADIMQMIADETIVGKSSKATVTPPSMIDGQVLSANHINSLADGVELDIISMRATLDEAWIILNNVIDNASRAIPVVENEASLVENTAIRALALTPQADAVRVGQEALNVSAGIGFGSIDGADMSLSSGIEVDLGAGSLTLQRSAVSVLPASAGTWSVDGEYSVSIDKTIGNTSWLTNDNIGQTWTVSVSSPSKYGRVSLTTEYDLIDPKYQLKRAEVLLPDYVATDVFIYVDFDGSGQWTFWERGAGKGRVIIDGTAVHAKRVRVVFSRYVANGSFRYQSRPRHEYTFQISEVVFASAAYAPEGNVVTDPIDISTNSVMSTIVDIDAVIPSTTYINVYLARDVEDPNSLSDFTWIPVDRDTNVVELSRISHEMETITAEAPVKVRTGAGVYSNSIYSIGEIDGVAVRVEEGFGQVETSGQTVYYADPEDYPAVNALGWTGVSPTVSSHQLITLTAGNYSKTSTNIWADVAGSHLLNIEFTDVDTYLIMLNGVNITSRIADRQTAASFVAGRNELVIYTKSDPNDSPTISIQEVPGCVIAIDRPAIVQETALITTENRVAQVGNSILVNHNPIGRIFRIAVKKASSGRVDSVRMRIELIRGLGGETPQVKSAYITTGV